MDSYVRRFIRSSLVWLGIGVTLGVGMTLRPAWLAIRPAHLHANLLGFVSMMIFGVGYHVFPRFVGKPVHSRRAAEVHLWLANLGLTGMVGGFILRIPMWRAGSTLLAVGGVLSAAGAGCFIYNVWRTLEPPPPRAGGLPRA